MEKSMIVGEDLEASEEEFDRSESLSLASHKKVKGADDVVVQGEDPESDLDAEDFGSTVSLTSSVESANLVGLSKQAPDTKTFKKIPHKVLTPAERLKERNPALYKKHYERNKSLRTNISDKFLHPVINQNIKKMDKLSQNLSNSQMQMQEALLQARLTTSNLLQLQKELENFVAKDYLSDVKIRESPGSKADS